jgi:hypothetical protein
MTVLHIQLVASSRYFGMYSAHENSFYTGIDTLVVIWIALILMARGRM